MDWKEKLDTEFAKERAETERTKKEDKEIKKQQDEQFKKARTFLDNVLHPALKELERYFGKKHMGSVKPSDGVHRGFTLTVECDPPFSITIFVNNDSLEYSGLKCFNQEPFSGSFSGKKYSEVTAEEIKNKVVDFYVGE